MVVLDDDEQPDCDRDPPAAALPCLLQTATSWVVSALRLGTVPCAAAISPTRLKQPSYFELSQLAASANPLSSVVF